MHGILAAHFSQHAIPRLDCSGIQSNDFIDASVILSNLLCPHVKVITAPLRPASERMSL